MTACWGVRMGVAGASDKFVDLGRATGMVAVGWAELEDLSWLASMPDDGRARKDLEGRFRKANGSLKDLEQILSFVRGMKVGDLVAVPNPSRQRVCIGRIAGPFEHQAHPVDDCAHRNRRRVTWLRDVPATEVPQELAAPLKLRGWTVVSLAGKEALLEQLAGLQRPIWEPHLERFSKIADAWLGEENTRKVLAYYDFFQDFVVKEQLEQADWPYFQQLGQNINAFTSLAIARMNALGKPNHPIEHYRRSFIELVHGKDDLLVRIDRFRKDPRYRLQYFGDSAISEILGYVFADRFMLWNRRDQEAATQLGIDPGYAHGDSYATKYAKFTKAVRPVVEAYERIVGRRTECPLHVEVDQFFSWLYENHPPPPPPPLPPYDLDTALTELFLEREQLQEIVNILRKKKNIVLQGPPGVGKTFMAWRLAWLMLGRRDDIRMRLVQFHQSMAYEDFVQGYRPAPGGGFVRKDGLFLRFCQQAASAPDQPHVLVIDEINRGNLSRIFGELLMLLEADKRSPMYAVDLAYSSEGERPFHIPENLYIIGTMNTADRSLAMVDYALRRRFRFFALEPAFGSSHFRDLLAENGLEPNLSEEICNRFKRLNQIIAEDSRNLGRGYMIGHSYFCEKLEEATDPRVWYQRIIDTEIAPLLREYWFDDEGKAEAAIQKLCVAF